MRISRLVVVLALVAGAVFAGLWGYSWYKVKTAMDRLVNESASYADVRYASIYVSPKLDGTVGVDGVVIKPKMTSDVFKIQAVRLTLPGIFYLVASKQEEMPESMHLVVNGLSFDLNSPLLQSLSKMQKEAERAQGKQSRSLLESYETLGCGSVESIGLDELTRMGYQTMSLDIDMEYRYAKVKNLLHLAGAARIQGMNGVEMSAELRIPPAELLHGKYSNVVIDSARLDIIDGGYAAQRNRFCAAQLEATERDFLNKNVELLSHELGAVFPPEAAEAYKKVMLGGRVSIGITPKPGTEFSMLANYPLKDVLDMLGFKLVLDSYVVDFDKLEWGKAYSTAPADERQEETVKNPTPTTPIARPATTKPAYHAIALSELARYEGYKVHLKTRTGVDRDGVIEEADAKTLTISQTIKAGKGFMSYTIAIADITSAEVFY